MVYNLAIRDSKNITPNESKFFFIDLRSDIKFFTRLSKFKENIYSLEEIDKFTSLFETEEDFKLYLLKKGIIKERHMDHDISIVFRKNGEYHRVSYGLVFTPIKKYLNPEYLRFTLIENSQDKEFLKKLTNHYYTNYNQEYLNMIRCYANNNDCGEININNSLTEFLNREIFVFDEKKKEYKIKYKNLHDLAMFVYNYMYKKDLLEFKKKCEEEKTNKVVPEDFSITSGSLQNYEETREKSCKKLIRRSDQLDGQISLFD